MKYPIGLFFILIFANNTFAQDTIRTYYDDESNLLKEIYLQVNGKAEGIIKRFDEEGKLTQIGTLVNNQRNGLFYDLDPETGDTVRITPFVNNQRSGIAKSFHPGGILQQNPLLSITKSKVR